MNRYSQGAELTVPVGQWHRQTVQVRGFRSGAILWGNSIDLRRVRSIASVELPRFRKYLDPSWPKGARGERTGSGIATTLSEPLEKLNTASPLTESRRVAAESHLPPTLGSRSREEVAKKDLRGRHEIPSNEHHAHPLGADLHCTVRKKDSRALLTSPARSV